MNIAILEGKPLVMMDSIKELETMGIHTIQLIYYTGDTFSEEYQLRVQQKCEEQNIEHADGIRYGWNVFCKV